MARDGVGHTTEWRIVYGVLVAVVATAFLYSLRGLLAPPLLYALLMVLLMPYAGTQRHRTLVISATVLIFVWLLWALGSLLAPFVLALIFAYILDPAADALERRGVPRWAAIAMLLLPVLGLIIVAFVLGIPALASQLDALIENVPVAAQRLEAWWAGMIERIRSWDLPFVSEQALLRQLDGLDEERITTFLRERQEEIVQRGWGAVTGVGRGIGFMLTILGYLVLTPVVLVYLLRDFDGVKKSAIELIPLSRRASWVSFLREYDRLLARYLRGQVLAASIVGVLTWVGLMIVGFPMAGLVGAVAGVFNLVPYLGLIVSTIPVFIIALFSGSFLASLLKAGIVFAIVQAIDGTVTGPRIVGESVGLHPVWVMLVLAIGSFFFGFVGLLLAMPVAVLVKLLLGRAVARYRASQFYTGSARPDVEL